MLAVMSEGKKVWSGRVAAIAIVTFIVGVLVLMFFAARGPR